jgi:hypothetical protein
MNFYRANPFEICIMSASMHIYCPGLGIFEIRLQGREQFKQLQNYSCFYCVYTGYVNLLDPGNGIQAV